LSETRSASIHPAPKGWGPQSHKRVTGTRCSAARHDLTFQGRSGASRLSRRDWRTRSHQEELVFGGVTHRQGRNVHFSPRTHVRTHESSLGNSERSIVAHGMRLLSARPTTGYEDRSSDYRQPQEVSHDIGDDNALTIPRVPCNLPRSRTSPQKLLDAEGGFVTANTAHSFRSWSVSMKCRSYDEH